MLPVEAQADVYTSARYTAGGDYSPPSLKKSEGINDSNGTWIQSLGKEASGTYRYKDPV